MRTRDTATVSFVVVLCGLFGWVLSQVIPDAPVRMPTKAEAVQVIELQQAKYRAEQPKVVQKRNQTRSVGKDMTVAGPSGPGTGSNVARGGSVATWSDPGNITANDSTNASAGFGSNGYSDWLQATNFGFSIPSGATIDGIEVTWKRQGDVLTDSSIKLVKGGTISGTDNSAGAAWPYPTAATATFGSPSDLWGLSWSDTDINASNFGAALSCATSSGMALPLVDYCEITVYYTGGTSPSLPDGYCAQQRRNQRSLSMWDLRQSTASQEIPLGPFVDDTDGKTAETALSIANTDIKLFKTGATTQASKNSGGATHVASGNYYAVLDATDTDTIGPMAITVQVAGALPVALYCRVLDEAVFDQQYGTSAFGGLDAAGTRSALGLASANLDTQLSAIDDAIDTEVGAIKAKTDQLTFTVPNQIDANTLSGGGTGLSSDITAIKAKTDNLPSDPADASVVAGLISAVETKVDTVDTVVDAIKVKTDQLTFTVANKVDATATLSAADSTVLSSGTATAGGNKTITLQTALGADNMGIGCKIKITSGTGSLQMRRVAGYVNSTKVLTVDRAWTTNPDATSVYAVVYDSDVGATVCRYGAAFTSSAGTTLKISAWLERDGQAVVLASGSCTVTYRENASGSDLFTVTDAAPNAQGIFELSQTSPGFTSDRLQVASVEITVGNDTWTTREPVPVFG